MHISILAITEQSNASTISCMAGAYDIFREAIGHAQKTGEKLSAKVELVGSTREGAGAEHLFRVQPQKLLGEVARTDLVIIPASLVRTYATATPANQQCMDWMVEQYRQGAELASMCTGAFTLAATGLLDKRTCSTHWSAAAQFRQLFPQVDLQTDRLITDEGGIYTNGGAYSFLQLLLYLVEKYFDRPTAVYCAKIFQIDLDRSLQSEFSIFSGHRQHPDALILEIQDYFESHYSGKISMEKLAEKYHVGRRNFDRRFINATGLSALDYLQRVRIEAAKRQLENARRTVSEVMYEVGYSDPKAFRQIFSRVTGLTPAAYKAKYNRDAGIVRA